MCFSITMQADARKRELHSDPLGEELARLQTQLRAQVVANAEARQRCVLFQKRA
jgi:hypothetical protein